MFDPSTPFVDLVSTDSRADPIARRSPQRLLLQRQAGPRRVGPGESCAQDAPIDAPDCETMVDRPDSGLAHRPAPDDVASLVGHLVGFHHAFLRRELPRLNSLLTSMVAAHSDLHPELHGIAATLAALTDELVPHMEWEEQRLFPLAEHGVDPGAAELLDEGSVRDVIKVVHAEHDRISELLTMLRAQTCGFTPPHGACLTWRALYAGLADFAVSTHQHVHLEDTALFPRLLELDGGFALSS